MRRLLLLLLVALLWIVVVDQRIEEQIFVVAGLDEEWAILPRWKDVYLTYRILDLPDTCGASGTRQCLVAEVMGVFNSPMAGFLRG